jgi:hypothetical protein
MWGGGEGGIAQTVHRDKKSAGVGCWDAGEYTQILLIDFTRRGDMSST